jgi:hypothetical protein
MLMIFNNPHKVVEVVLQRTGAPFEVMAELWDFFRRPDRLNASFKARSATLGKYLTYPLLLGKLSPVLHVEGSRTRPGIILLVIIFAAFHQTFSTFAPLRSVHHCPLFCSLPVTAFRRLNMRVRSPKFIWAPV